MSESIEKKERNKNINTLIGGLITLLQGDMGEISDGYHTFNELYEHRIMLFILLAKTIAPFVDSAYRFHHYEGWFCLGLETKYGQISYHVPEKYWDLCDFAEERQPNFDGHTSKDVLDRLSKLISE